MVAWLHAALTGQPDERFHEELRVRYYFSFFRTRWPTLAHGLGQSRSSPRLYTQSAE